MPFIAQAIENAKGSITTIELDLHSLLEEDSPLFDEILAKNLASIKSMEVNKMQITGNVLRKHLPHMINLNSLRLPVVNRFLFESTSATAQQMRQHGQEGSEQHGVLLLPQSLQELELASSEYPPSFTPWTFTGALVRLSLDCETHQDSRSSLDLVSD